jgi:hypothetical protein
MTTIPTVAGSGFGAWAAELREKILARYGIAVDTGTDEFRAVHAERFSVDEMMEADRAKRVPMAVIAAYTMVALYREHALKVGARPLTVLEA